MPSKLSVVGGEEAAQVGHAAADVGGLFDGDVGAPDDEVPTDLVAAASGEADGQGTVLVGGHGLVGVEDEVSHVLRCLRVEV